jgi:NTE family protein
MFEVYRRAFVASNPLADFTIPFVSLVSGHKVSRLLREAFGERCIEDLALPFFCVSSNLTTGRACAHRSGPLWQWLRASLAIPGVLPPVFHSGNVYVDGGVTENLPVALMRDWQRGEVIASDIGGDRAVKAPLDEFELPPLWRMVVQWHTGIRRPGLLSVLLGAGMVNAGAASLAARSAATLLLAPALHEIELLEWRAFDRAIEIGYRHTQRVLSEAGDRVRAQLEQAP